MATIDTALLSDLFMIAGGTLFYLLLVVTFILRAFGYTIKLKVTK